MVLPFQFEDREGGQIEQLDDSRGIRCEGHEVHSSRTKKIHHITGEMTLTIIYQQQRVFFFDSPLSMHSYNMRHECGL
jgi:hypothetical protein